MSANSQVGRAASVQSSVEAAIRELNAVRSKVEQIGTDADTRLLGDGGALDSLGFVNFVVSLDGHLAQLVSPDASVMAELLAAPDPDAFATVGRLVAYVTDKLAPAE
jgi:acyl carrier protein